MKQLTATPRSRARKLAIGLTGGALALTGLIANANPSGADPKQFKALVGVGSDTTQDIMNALAGESNGQAYAPIVSSAATGNRQITSWDATGTTCITPAAPGATFLRPNGSTNGRKALSRAIDGTKWGDGSSCGGNKTVSGLVHFARSSSGPSGTGTDLTYVPFGRDAMSFAYYRASGAPVTTLTSADLTALHTTGPITVDGVKIVACIPQTGSGTYQFWRGAVGSNDTAMTSVAAQCDPDGAGPLTGFLQESDGAALKVRGDALNATDPGVQVVIGFSAANFISQSNGVAKSQLVSGVDLGEIDALGKPYVGTAPNLTPSSSFYASSKYGRDVFNVFPTEILTADGNNDLKSLFIGSSSSICSSAAQTTVNAFGFLSLGTACGSTTKTGPLV